MYWHDRLQKQKNPKPKQKQSAKQTTLAPLFDLFWQEQANSYHMPENNDKFWLASV